MRIKQLQLKGFRLFEDLTIDFPESKMIVLIGENGSGKSSVLDGLSTNLGYFITSITRVKENYTYYPPHLQPKHEDINSNDTFYKINLNFQFCKKNINYSIQFEKENGLIASMLPENFIEKQQENLSDLINDKLGIPIITTYLSERNTYKEERDNVFKYSFNEFYTYHNAIASVNKYSSFRNWFINEENIENAKKLDNKDFNFETKNLKPIRNALICFLNEMDEEGSISNIHVVRKETMIPDFAFPDAGAEIFFEKNNKPLAFSQLSSGEKMILMLVCDIARRLAIANPNVENALLGEGLVLIDEIELHLHPKWQRNITVALQKTFPNVQFIVTTHSPQVLSRVPTDNVIILENQQAYKPGSNPLGRDSNGILSEIMGVSERPNEVEKNLDEIFELIANNEIEEAEKLVEKVKISNVHSADDPIYTRIDAMIQRKKMLAK